MLRSTICIASALFLSACCRAEETGTLRLRIQCGGNPPQLPDPGIVQVPGRGLVRLRNERLLVHPENGGIKNAVLYLHTGRGGSRWQPPQRRAEVRTLAIRNARFEPPVLSLQTGDTLRVRNNDPNVYSPIISFFNIPAAVNTIAGGGGVQVPIQAAQPGVIPVECNIHLWMRAYLIVLDHPIVGISDEDGEIEIRGLPVDEPLVFRLWLEAASGAIPEVTINGEAVMLRRNTLELAIKKAGVNDLGTITIPAAALKP